VPWRIQVRRCKLELEEHWNPPGADSFSVVLPLVMLPVVCGMEEMLMARAPYARTSMYGLGPLNCASAVMLTFVPLSLTWLAAKFEPEPLAKAVIPCVESKRLVYRSRVVRETPRCPKVSRSPRVKHKSRPQTLRAEGCRARKSPVLALKINAIANHLNYVVKNNQEEAAVMRPAPDVLHRNRVGLAL
jgi:hypothetical protein